MYRTVFSSIFWAISSLVSSLWHSSAGESICARLASRVCSKFYPKYLKLRSLNGPQRCAPSASLSNGCPVGFIQLLESRLKVTFLPNGESFTRSMHALIASPHEKLFLFSKIHYVY